MKLTVLGNCGPYPGLDRACSGYLLEHDEYKILLDCGNGVLSNLQKYCKIEELTHIILSHLHYDHISDIFVLKYAIEIKRKQGRDIKPIKLYLPNEPESQYKNIVSKNIFEVQEVNEQIKFNIGDLKFSFAKMKHTLVDYATRIQYNDKVFVYTGDTAYNYAIAEFAQNADILLCDAGLLEKYKKDENVPHLTAYEVGLVAKEAGVKMLLLTHFWPEDDTRQHLDEARENFPQAEVAKELNTYEI